eukprot:1087950-Alexandrium_andersonii.AAC.1
MATSATIAPRGRTPARAMRTAPSMLCRGTEIGHALVQIERVAWWSLGGGPPCDVLESVLPRMRILFFQCSRGVQSLP